MYKADTFKTSMNNKYGTYPNPNPNSNPNPTQFKYISVKIIQNI